MNDNSLTEYSISEIDNIKKGIICLKEKITKENSFVPVLINIIRGIYFKGEIIEDESKFNLQLIRDKRISISGRIISEDEKVIMKLKVQNLSKKISSPTRGLFIGLLMPFIFALSILIVVKYSIILGIFFFGVLTTILIFFSILIEFIYKVDEINPNKELQIIKDCFI